MNTEMKIFETEIKDIQEIQAKARKYDELKEAVGKIKEDIAHERDMNFDLVDYGLQKAQKIIDKHISELRGDADGKNADNG